MTLELYQIVQRQEPDTKRWTAGMLIDSEEKLQYHREYQSMDYQYRLLGYEFPN